MYSIKYNEQGETLYSIRYYCQCLQVWGGFSSHHQELKYCTHSVWYVPGLQAWHVPDDVCTVLELLMTGG